MEKSNIVTSCKLLVIGGSAGSLEVIMHVLPLLRPDLRFPIIIVIHRKSDGDSQLAQIFATKTSLKVLEAEEKDVLLPSTIYLAPPDYHLLVERDHTISLDFSEKVNYSRPSIDVTFETAAEAFGGGLVCILLSGASADGAKGLAHVKKRGGQVVVQDPETAEVSYMPEKAIALVRMDAILRPDGIASYINALA